MSDQLDVAKEYRYRLYSRPNVSGTTFASKTATRSEPWWKSSHRFTDDCNWDFDARAPSIVPQQTLAICESNMKVIQEHFIQLNVNSAILCLKGRE